MATRIEVRKNAFIQAQEESIRVCGNCKNFIADPASNIKGTCSRRNYIVLRSISPDLVMIKEDCFNK